MNSYFRYVFIPMFVWTVGIGIAEFHHEIQLNWWLIFGIWFLMGPVGQGVGFHKLFSHRQIDTWKPIEYLLAILGTWSFYAPVLFWTAIHQKHHMVADTIEDPSSPDHYGFWESFFTYRMRKEALQKTDIHNRCVRRIVKDKFLMFLSKEFILLFYFTAFVLWITGGPWALANFLIVPAMIEHCRVNMVSSLSHMKIPGSYRNFDTPDKSWNHVLLGYLTFGFGWHNNHHKHPREIVNSHRWFEIDIEGLIAKSLDKKTWTRNHNQS
jgi:stearoyl-CoA desaturase (delta-9 desaturase)